MNFLSALVVVVGVLAGMSYSYQLGFEHGVGSVEQTVIKLNVIKERCIVDELEWEGEA